jgi:hypothetical protein
MREIHKITDDTNYDVMEILKNGLSMMEDNKDIIKNYHPDYASSNSNLFYILKEGRYKTGGYFVITEDGKYIGSAGWNPYYNDTVLLGTRFYVLTQHRHHTIISKNILPICIKESWEYKHQWITINHYNYTWYKALSRKRWDHVSLIKHLEPLGMKEIYYTHQWVLELNKESYLADGLL